MHGGAAAVLKNSSRQKPEVRAISRFQPLFFISVTHPGGGANHRKFGAATVASKDGMHAESWRLLAWEARSSKKRVQYSQLRVMHVIWRVFPRSVAANLP